MLVLPRKAGQRIQIGRSVTLTIVSLKGGHVRIGINGQKTSTFFAANWPAANGTMRSAPPTRNQRWHNDGSEFRSYAWRQGRVQQRSGFVAATRYSVPAETELMSGLPLPVLAS